MADKSEKKKSNYNSIVPAVDQAMQLLASLGQSSNQGLTLTEICEQLDLPKSKGYTILNTLSQHDFVEKDSQTKTYRLGLKIVYLARNILNNIDIRDIVSPHLKKLATETGLTAHFGMRTDSRVYIIAKQESGDGLGYSMRVGVNHPLTYGAHGKAIVAMLPKEEQKEILAGEDLHFYGYNEKVDFDFLHKELEECRRIGYAVDPGDTNPDIRAICSASLGGDEKVVGSVILVGVFRQSKVKKYGPLVAQAAAHISATLGYCGSVTHKY
jgi:DNA-binding IclR family transcriptional regulator